ncbi:MAG TPA: hypothetical protein VK816_10840 [Jatrophihabitantaceae bacterium]|jgi:hypothetical protein|nr:hypothetical protein [Jatrophihabitantaceae bacterium]
MNAFRRLAIALTAVIAAAMLLGGFAAAASATATYPPATPTSTPTSDTGAGTITAANTNPSPGGTDSVTATGFLPGETASFDLHSVVVHLGDSTVDAAGNATLSFTIPSSFSGAHTVTVTGLTSGRVQSIGINVGGSSSGSSSSSGSLAFTGAAVVGLTVLAVILLGGGIAMVVVGRRRTPTSTH